MFTDFIFSLRRLLKNRLFFSINLFGLSIGLAVAIILVSYVNQEFSYDQYHEKSDRIYKVISRFFDNKGNDVNFSITYGVLADSYRENFPEVEEATKYLGPWRIEIESNNLRYNNITAIFSDKEFFNVFDFPGYNTSMFSAPNEIIISQELAKKLFHDQDPVDRIITYDNKNYKVSGVIEIPKNTRFQFDIAFHGTAIGDIYTSLVNGGLEFETFLVLTDDSPETLKKLSGHYNNLMKEKWPNYDPYNYLISLEDVYLYSEVPGRWGSGSKEVLFVVLGIGIFIFILALINYLNLQIAHNFSRILEAKIKKVLGASKLSHIRQGIVESLIIILFSGVASLVLAEIFYNFESGRIMGESVITVREWSIAHWAIFIAVLIAAAILIGFLPAQSLFSESLKGNALVPTKPRISRSTIYFVIFQFFCASALLSSILLIQKQMQHMEGISPGYSRENIIVINNLNEKHQENYREIKNELSQYPNILNIAGGQTEPGRGASGQYIYRAGKPEESGISIAHIRTIDNYIETFGLELVAGRNFSELNNENEFILNQTAVKKLFDKNESPLGEQLVMGSRKGKLIGIVNDFHITSFKYDVSPLVLNVERPYGITMAFKLSEGSINQSLTQIQNTLIKFDPKYVMDYYFLDEAFDRTYKAELKAKRIIFYGTLVAILICALGILGLTIFIVNNKTKEIAIRKVLGADQGSILWQLSHKLILWIVIANVITVPIVIYGANRWLENYIYRINLIEIAWIIPLSAVITLVISFLVIFKELFNISRINPVVYLRSE